MIEVIPTLITTVCIFILGYFYESLNIKSEFPLFNLIMEIPLSSILLFFAYPLVILSYFSGKKLKPIKTSISIVFKKAGLVKFVFLIMILKYGLNISDHYLNL